MNNTNNQLSQFKSFALASHTHLLIKGGSDTQNVIPGGYTLSDKTYQGYYCQFNGEWFFTYFGEAGLKTICLEVPDAGSF